MFDFDLEIMKKTSQEKDDGKKKGGKGRAGVSTSSSDAKVCLHCGDLKRKGQEVRLHDCECGKSFHHLCAGEAGHESWNVCIDCAASTEKPVRHEGKECGMEKAFKALSEAHTNLEKASTAYQLSGRKDSLAKENEFGKALDIAGDCVKAAWRAWNHCEDGPSKLKDDTRSLVEAVIESMKEIPDSKFRLRGDMAFIKRDILGCECSFKLDIEVISERR